MWQNMLKYCACLHNELNILLADHSYSLLKDISILLKLGRVIILMSVFFFLQWHCQCDSTKTRKSKGYRAHRALDLLARICGAMSSHCVLKRV